MLHLRLRPCNIAPSLTTKKLQQVKMKMALALSSTVAPRFLPQRLPRVCLALGDDTVEDMLATAESLARDNPFLEFRLDYLKQPLAALPKIHRFLETHQYVTAIGTCRRADHGGKFKGSLASELEVLT